MATVVFENATLVYPGASNPSVRDLNLEIADGEFLVLIGPSGCGKTTSLRMLAGLEAVTSGRVLIGGRDVTRTAPANRDIAMVFQNYALYPHMTVAGNMGYALKIRKVAKDERMRRVKEAARLLDLEDLLDRKPAALSGGQRQRVAMGRAIVRDPQAFLMDEPLSNLDAKLRVQTRGQISALARRLGVTTLYVTHDQTEALTMGDRVAVLKDGVLQQVGEPRELYAAPCNVFVAGFIGSPAMNILGTSISESGVRLGDAVLPVPREALAAAGNDEILVGVRPEDLRRCGSSEPGLRVIVEMVEELGADTFVYGHSESDGQQHPVVARFNGGDGAAVGEAIMLTAPADKLHLFDQASEQRLNGPTGRTAMPAAISA
jgi:multiple sugar transport system ATP-binding protein